MVRRQISDCHMGVMGFCVRIEAETADGQTADVRHLLSFVGYIELPTIVCNRKWLERCLRGGGRKSHFIGVRKRTSSHSRPIIRRYAPPSSDKEGLIGSGRRPQFNNCREAFPLKSDV